MKPLLRAVVAVCLLLAANAHPENIEQVKELKETKDTVLEADESEPNARVERCTTCSGGAKINLSPNDILGALRALPPGQVHTEQSYEGCSLEKGCAGIKVKDGQVIEKYGNSDSFKAAAAANTANEFTFHAAGALGDAPFWWMNENSPFKNGGGNLAQYKASSSSSFSSSGTGVGTSGSGSFGASLDLGGNPFLNGASKSAGGFSSSAQDASFGASSKGGDFSNNPFLNGAFQNQGGNSGQGSFTSSASGSGYVGSSPRPFTASTPSNVNFIQNGQKTSEYDYEQTQQSFDNDFQNCGAQGYVCVLKGQCNNGVVSVNGAGTKKQSCNTRTEVCCRIDASLQGSFTGSGSQLTASESQAGFGASTSGFGSSFGSKTSNNQFSSSGFGSTASGSFGSSTATPVTGFNTNTGYKATSQSNFIDSDSANAGSSNVGVFRPGASGSGLKPGIPYLPPDRSPSSSNVVTSTVFPSTTLAPAPRPTFTTPRPTYRPSTSAPAYLPPPIQEPTNIKEVIVPKPTYSEGEIILDANRQPKPKPTPGITISTIPVGCAAALKCVPIEFCTADGVMSNASIFLTNEQQAYRVPLTDCKNPETGAIGKCCRDPNYSDPWPTNQLGQWVQGVFGGNDGKYVPDRASPDLFRPSSTPRPSTGTVTLGDFRNTKPTTTPFGPNQVTPGYSGTTVSQGNYGQGQFTQTGQGSYAQKGQGTYTQKGQGQIGQFGQGSQGQFGVVGQGQIGKGTQVSQGTRGQGQVGTQGQFGQGNLQFGGELEGQGQGTQFTGVQKGIQGQGQIIKKGQGQIVAQGQGFGVSKGQGQTVITGQGTGIRQGQGFGVSQGQGNIGVGQTVSQGQGIGVKQGQGFGVTQSKGQTVSQGVGVTQAPGFGVTRGQGQIVSQGQGVGITQGQGLGISQGQGFGVSQGQGTATIRGQGTIGKGQVISQGQGVGVSQGVGIGTTQGQGAIGAGQGVSQGVGFGVSQTKGQGVITGQGQIVSQGQGFGVTQGQGQRIGQGQGTGVSQGQGFGVSQGQGAGVSQGQGFRVSQGQGAGVSQGQGFGVSQGQGLGVSQGQGFGIKQGQGFGVSQGVGQGVSQGIGQGVSQGIGQGVSQGQGFGVKQGQGFGVSQGQGQGISQGQGFGINQGQGLGVSQGQGFGVSQGQGQLVSQGQGFGVKQGQGQFGIRGESQFGTQGVGFGVQGGQGVLTSQGFGAKLQQEKGTQVENDFGESVMRVSLKEYNAGKQCGQYNNLKPYGNHDDQEVDFAEIPWQAMILLQTNRSLLCGGVITRPDVVITSAACVEGLEAKNVLIKGGEYKLGVDEEPLPFQIVQVKHILRHPYFKAGSLHYDAAILVLEEDLNLAKNIYPICLPGFKQTLESFYEGQGQCIVTGWGKIVLQAHLEGAIMHSLNVSLIRPNECQAKITQDYPHLLEQYDEDSCICGEPSNPLDNICRVDIGSALACSTGDGNYVMRGVYSWDSGCQGGNQLAGFYKFDMEWYEWAIGLIESVRFAKFGIGTKVSQKVTTQVTSGVKGIQFGNVKGSSGSKGYSVAGPLGQDKVKLTGGIREFIPGQFGQFVSGKYTEKTSGETEPLDIPTGIETPGSNTFTATYSEKKVYESEPKFVTFTTKPEIVTFTTKPEIVTFTTQPKYYTYTTKPEIVTYTTKPKYFSYTTKPEIVTYTTKPEYVTFTTKPKLISYQGSATNEHPSYAVPGVSYNPSFSELVGQKHNHSVQCKCLEGKK